MSEEVRPGYYKDKSGEWHKDRRQGNDRRGRESGSDHERRVFLRRKEDREHLEREQREMIEDALEEFAAEHDQHH